ncbi:MAG: LIC12192 family sporadic carbohydrate cluster protein [Rhodospirillaceae bacterium]
MSEGPAKDAKAGGFRGYIASRPVNGVPYPHRVQNLVIRDYCQRKGLLYYLSSTEVAVPGSFMMLNDVMTQLDGLAGIVIFSQFILPPRRVRRLEIYDRILQAGCQLHAALEDTQLSSARDISAFDAVLSITPWLSRTPFQGRFPITPEALSTWDWIAKNVPAGGR